MVEGYVSGKPDLAYWNQEIRQGIQDREREAFESEWPRWRRQYRGQWKKGVMPVNLFFTLLRTVVPRVYFRNPSVSVQADKPGELFVGFAKILQRADMKLMARMHMKTELKRMIQDAFLYGTGVGKLGFGAQFSYDLDGDTSSPRIGKGKESIEYRDYILPNMPWFARVHTRNFILPAGAEAHHSARWSATISPRSVEDVRRDPRLSKKARNEIQPTALDMKSKRQQRLLRGRNPGSDEIDIIELRDKKTGKVIVFAPNQGRGGLELYSGLDPLLSHGFPEYPLVFNVDSDTAWGIPDSQILDPYQHEINEIRTQQMLHRRLAVVKILAQKESIDESELEKLVSEDVSPVVLTNKDPRLAIETWSATDATVTQQLVLAAEQVMQDFREGVGFSRNQSGEFREGSEAATATEANIVRMASEIRVDERRDIVADLLVDVIDGMHNLMFSFWGQDEIVDVVGPGGVPVWVRFQKDMLKIGQYAVKVDPDTSVPETKSLREQRAVQLYGLLKENPLIDPLRLTQYLLHEFHGVQFDEMIRQLPQQGTPPRGPISPLDFSQMISQAANNNPAMMAALNQLGGSAFGEGA